MSDRRAHFLALFVWTLLCVLFFWSFLNGAAHLADGDFTGQFHASARHQGQAIFGDTPTERGLLWSPSSYAGFPFAADPQTAVFYPPRWLTLLLARPWDFPVYALQLEAIFHVWLAGLFTYWLAFDLTRRQDAALLAALAFGLGGYLTSYPLLQLAVLESVIWLPLTLLLLRRGVASPRPVPWLAAAGLSLGLSALAGHPQTFLHVSYATAAYYLFLTARARWSWPPIIKLGGLTMGAALGTATVALLPTLHYMLYTTRRSVGYEFAAAGQPLENYVQLILPGLRSHWVPEYSGIIILLLALAAWFGRRVASHEQKGEILFWTAATLLAAWLSLGDNGILFQLAYRLLPGFSLFQQQERLVSLVSLGLALLAALGATIWLQADAAVRRRLWQQGGLVTAVLLLIGAVYAVANPDFSGQPWPALWARQAGLLAVSLALLALPHSGKLSPGRVFLLLLIPLLFFDLYANTSGSVDRRPGSPAIFWPQPAWMQQLQAELPPLTRIDSQNLFHADVGAGYDLEDAHGISPLKWRWWADLGQLPPERRWQLLGVSHVLSYGPPTPQAEPIAVVQEHIYPERQISAYLYRLPTPLPRAWLSYQPILVDSEEAARQMLAAPEFDPAAQVIVHPPAPDLAEIAPPARPPSVATTRLANDQLRMTVQTETAGILVISEWRYPGWRARLNGRPVDLFPANYAFMGVHVPPGDHELLLTFRPWDAPVGAAVTLLTLLAVGLLAWRWRPIITYHPATPSPEPVEGELRQAQPPASTSSAFGSYRPAVSKGSPLPGGKWGWRLLLLALTLLAFGLRLYTLSSQELRGDETYGYPFVRLPMVEMLQGIIALGEEHPPLHYIMLNGWMRLAGDSELAMRFLAVVPGVLLVPLLWQAGRRWRGRSLGLLLALFAAISPQLVWLGQDVRNQYVMVIFSGALATLLFQRALRRPHWTAWAAYALLCALTIYSHYYGIFALLAHGLALLVLPEYRRHLPAYALSGAAGAVLFAPWLYVTLSGWVGQLSQPSGMELAPYLQRVGREITVGASFPAGPGRWLFLGALGLAFTGWRAFWRRDRLTAVILAAWLGGTFAGVFLVLLQRDIFNAYYVSPATPAWWALVAMGLVSLRERRSRWAQGLAWSGALLLILAAAVSLNAYYRDPVEHGRTRGYRDVAAHVGRYDAPNDLFLANSPDPSLGYYLRGLEVTYAMQPDWHETAPAVTEQALADLAAQYDRFWFVPDETGLWDGDAVVSRWLNYHTLIEEQYRFKRLTLTAYRPAHAVDAVMTPLQETLHDWALLEGYYLTVDGAPCAPLRPESELAVTLIWRGLSTPPANYTVFVHLLRPDGNLIAQHDGTPLAGTRPTTTWQAGERLLDRHTLPLPATAALEDARLVVGLYDSQTIIRLPWANGQDSLPLNPEACVPRRENR